MSKLLRVALLLLSLCSVPAFAKEPLMVRAEDQNPKPEPGKALLVFVRAAFVGGGIASTVYDAPDDATRFLGALIFKQKMAVQMEPGEHRLMVVSENADFVDVKLDADKTYYLLVSPRPGVWKARFSLLPIHNRADAKYNLLGEDFKKWMEKTEYVTPTPAAAAWYEEHKGSVAEKKTEYLVKWNKMDAPDRAELVLHAEDGVVAK
ncbi:hypothetical protein J5226_02480 [Lysobacter sp. K5869]|uniref:hypothetical protein n=1 Tax=Lysobacter sp. K5869 TaxID=2820808 RepID=UPI001C05F876|nr:hypothetical protein [Lysobacter sp. K5869]QWP77293.1 hypothetical protein J5226_02480 [Lysobacter sp. K5869]